MSRTFQLYRQDVMHEQVDGGLVIDTSHLDDDLPATGDKITLVEFDGTEREMEADSWVLVIRPKAAA